MGQDGTWPLETEDANSQVLGVEVKNLLNDLRSSHSGSSEPSTPVLGQLWWDTSTTPAQLKIYDGANWIPHGPGGHLNTTLVTTATYTVLADDQILIVDASSNAVELDFPTAVGIDGKPYWIIFKDLTNAVTLDPNGGETIGGITTPVIHANHAGSVGGQALCIVSDDVNWLIREGIGLGFGDVLIQANDQIVHELASFVSAVDGAKTIIRKARGTMDVPSNINTNDILHDMNIQGRLAGSWVNYLTMQARAGVSDIDALRWSFQARNNAGLMRTILFVDNPSGEASTRVNVGSFVQFRPKDFGDDVITTPVQLAGSKNDWADITEGMIFLIDANAGGYNVTGIVAPNPTFGRFIYLTNDGANSINFTNQDAASTAANRIITGTGATIALPADATISLYYETVAARWRVWNLYP